jgi:tetratricopeptide (TPR) repeat protein
MLHSFSHVAVPPISLQRRPLRSSGMRSNVSCGRGNLLLRIRRRAEPDILGKLKDKNYLDLAAKRFLLALKNGMSEEEAFDMEFKGSSLADLYKDKLKLKLEARANELKQEEATRLERESRNYKLGKEAYEAGEYFYAVKLLELGIADAGPDTPTGGDARLWLALSLQALGRESEAIETCRQLEESHPSRKVKKQAAEVRYILEAPKLPPEPGETVVIPTIKSDTWRKDARKSKPVKAKKVESSYWDRAWALGSGSDGSDSEGAKWYVPVSWAVVLLIAVVGNAQLKTM